MCCVYGPCERLDAPSICCGLCFILYSRKSSPHFGVSELGHRCLLFLCCFFVWFCILCIRVRACNWYAYFPLVCCACLPLVWCLGPHGRLAPKTVGVDTICTGFARPAWQLHGVYAASFGAGKLESTHPSRVSVKSTKFISRVSSARQRCLITQPSRYLPIRQELWMNW